MITAKTVPYGLFGCPVEHSFSPQMHNSVFNKLNLNCVYLAFEIEPEELKVSLNALINLGFKGINITVPHKQSCMQYLHKIDEEAQIIGAVNTVKIKQSKLIGYNTDGIGFLNSLSARGIQLTGSSVWILGAGGASRAISISMIINEDIKKVYIYDIDSSKAMNLVNDLNAIKKDIAFKVDEENLNDVAGSIDILVNATPVGLNQKDIPISLELLNPDFKLVYDLIYNPSETELLKLSKEKGIETMNGMKMLVHQGAASFKIWTGIKPPVNVMESSVNKCIYSKK